MLRKNEATERGRPKALYDDLESAHGSIARKGSASQLTSPSTASLTPNLPPISATGLSVPSPALKPETMPFRPTTPQSQPPSLPKASGSSLPRDRLSRNRLMKQESELFVKLPAGSRIEGGERPVVRDLTMPKSTDFSMQEDDPAEALLQDGMRQRSREENPKSAQDKESRITETLESSPSSPHMPQGDYNAQVLKDHAFDHICIRRLVEDDTVGDILQTDGAQLPAQSREHAHDVCNIVYEDTPEVRKGPGSEVVIRDGKRHQKTRQDNKTIIPKNIVQTQATIMSTPTQSAREIHTGPIDRDDSGPLSQDLFESVAQNSDHQKLDQYAWSPCPSDDGLEESDLFPTSETPFRKALKSQPDAARDGGSRTPDSEDSAALLALHCRNHKLTYRLSADKKLSTASDSILWRNALSFPTSSNLAGDLHMRERHVSARSKSVSCRSIGRFSGVVSDGTSSRPLSEAEVAHSLNQMIESTLRRPDSSCASSQAEVKVVTVHEQGLACQVNASKVNHFAEDLASNLGLGSSQTTSSSNHELLIRDIPGRMGRVETCKHSSSSLTSPVRAATPPGLFGRRAMTFSDGSAESRPSDSRPSDVRPPLVRSNSRLAQAAAAAGIKEDGRLGRALAGSAEQDWVTETEIKTSTENTGIAQLETSTGSSLADNSESGSLSPMDHARRYPVQSEEDILLQYSSHPRYNHSWSIVKNVQTGAMVILPDYVSREGSRLPNFNLNFQARSFTNPGPNPMYQHPKPLPKGHPNPLNSSPHMTPYSIKLRESDQPDKSTQQKRMERDLTSSDFSSITDDNDKRDTYQGTCGTQLSGSDTHEATDTMLQAMNGLNKASQYASSAWLSTVSESESSEPSLPNRISSFAKMTVLGHKANLTGTPEGTGAREVGSSLADASSPGAKLSSSPVIFSSSPATLASSPPYRGLSPIADYTTSLSKPQNAVKAFHRHLEEPDFDFTSPWQHQSENPSSSHQHDSFGYNLGRRTDRSVSNHRDSPSIHARARQLKNRLLAPREVLAPVLLQTKSSSNAAVQSEAPLSKFPGNDLNPTVEEFVDWSKYLPATGLPVRRRCSSSESEDRTSGPPLAQKASGLQPASTVGHQKRRSAGTVVQKREVEPNDLECGMYPSDINNNTEGQPCLFKHVPPQSSSPISYNGTVHIKKPTLVLDQKFCGYKCNRDRRLRCPVAEKKQFSRPIARNASPHICHVPRKPDAATISQHVRISRLWALVCIFIPFLGPLYGHGFLDGIIAWHSDGTIQSFRPTEKVAILVYSYAFFGTVLIALALAMILITR
ncbi:MAG: hypothetical protein Q9164_000343 [Protoblastenia rupestris]